MDSTASVLALAVGYLLGSIPFGLLLTRIAGLGDIRKIGSGNIGATNVLRTGKRGLAAATLVLDGGKGGAAVLLAGWVGGPWAEACGRRPGCSTPAKGPRRSSWRDGWAARGPLLARASGLSSATCFPSGSPF